MDRNSAVYRLYRDSVVQELVTRVKLTRQVSQWERNGRPSKVPHLVKQRTLREYARRFGTRTLVETGTFRGDMIFALRRTFREIYSIELDPTLHRAAVQRFSRIPHVVLLQGDSGTELPKVMERLRGPALFWLDAHYSGGVTARAAVDTPISQELELVLRHPADHVVLIDDAHEFVGQNGYPTLQELREQTDALRTGLAVESRDNIIRIHRRD